MSAIVHGTRVASSGVKIMGDRATWRRDSAATDLQHAMVGPFERPPRSPLCVLDRSLRCVRANESMAKLTGRPAVDHVGHSLRELLPPLATSLNPLCARVLATGEPFVNVELRVGAPGRPEGEERWFADAIPRFDNDESIFGVTVVLRAPTDAERLRREVGDRSRFEQMLADLSVAFIGSPPGDIDTQIQRGIERVVSLFDLDLGTFSEFEDERGTLTAHITHWYARPGLTIELPERGEHEFPWYVAQVRNGCLVRIASLADMPPEAAVDRASTAKRGIRSVVVCPVIVDGSVGGAVSFNTVRQETHWPDDLVRRLQVVAQIFGTALARKRADERMRRHQAALAHIGRVSAMGALVAAITHELRQPLAAVRANAQALRRMLAGGTLERVELDEALGDVAADAVRADEILQHLRALFRKEEAQQTVLDLNEMIRDIEPLLRADARAHDVRLRLDLAAQLSPTIGDRVQLQQVVINLIRNGAEAMAAAGRTRDLELRTTQRERGIAEVSVHDAGPAVDDTVFAHLFEPFYTTKPTGLGVGLSLSRSIVEAHGGSLVAERNVDEGLTMRFTVRCPPQASLS